MRLIYNDKADTPLIDTRNLSILKRVFDKFAYKLEQDAVVFETIHGYIVSFKVQPARLPLMCANNPNRLDSEELAFWASLVDKIRWFEPGVTEIKVALIRCSELPKVTTGPGQNM